MRCQMLQHFVDLMVGITPSHSSHCHWYRCPPFEGKTIHIHHWLLQILEHDKWRLLGSITSQGKVEGQGEGGKKLQRRKKVERNKLKRQANEKLMRHRLPKDARRIETLSLRQLGRIKVANYLHLLTWPHLVSLCPLFVNTTWWWLLQRDRCGRWGCQLVEVSWGYKPHLMKITAEFTLCKVEP